MARSIYDPSKDVNKATSFEQEDVFELFGLRSITVASAGMITSTDSIGEVIWASLTGQIVCGVWSKASSSTNGRASYEYNDTRVFLGLALLNVWKTTSLS